MNRMIAAMVLSLTALAFALAGTAEAQQRSQQAVWIQIAARPSLQAAQAEARNYAARLPDVAGFTLGGGWYGIVIGPYARDDAERVLQVYRTEGQIPRDSFIAFPRSLGSQFYPVGPGQAEAPAPAPAPEPAAPQLAEPDRAESERAEEPEPQQLTALPDETPAQARRSEAALSRQERMDLQTALKAAGFYDAAIDGAFGRGTRASMGAWQAAQGFEATGILTTAQRKMLMDSYNAPLISAGMARVEDKEAGIALMIPSAEIAFDRYEPPFAHYASSGSLGARVLLISQPGDRRTLQGLYDIMQTLDVVPLDGPRARSGNRFTIEGRNGEIVSYTEAALENGEIKGFTLIWPADDEARRTRVLAAMQESFTRLDGVLEPAAGDGAQAGADLVAGLAVRKPLLSRSGFFVDDKGAVVTSADVTEGCGRITLDHGYEAGVAPSDPATGIAVVPPAEPLAPMSVAGFLQASPPVQSDVAVAGFSYDGVLGAPSLTWGRLTDSQGLDGDTRVARLDITAQPGDAGGPVMDGTGAVIGMLLPRSSDGRQLPEGVHFAATADTIRTALDSAGLSAAQPAATGTPLPNEAIVRLATGMTVLVSCWE